MKFFRGLMAAWILTSASATLADEPEQQPEATAAGVVSERLDVTAITVFLSAADEDGQPVTDLTTLLSAIPVADPNRPPQPIAMVKGELPAPTNPPPGCRFHTRCPQAQAICTQIVPPLDEIGEGHSVACHFPLTATA